MVKVVRDRNERVQYRVHGVGSRYLGAGPRRSLGGRLAARQRIIPGSYPARLNSSSRMDRQRSPSVAAGEALNPYVPLGRVSESLSVVLERAVLPWQKPAVLYQSP